MQRRRALHIGISVGTVILAGCLGDGESSTPATDGDDDSPIDADPESLLLSASAVSDVLGGDWHAGDPHESTLVTRGTDAKAGFSPARGDDGSDHMGWINAGVWTFETVDAAREEYDGHGYQTGYAFEDAEIAVESIAGTVDRSEGAVLFRDANAVGAVARTAPDTSEDELVNASLRLAAAMHRSWRDG